MPDSVAGQPASQVPLPDWAKLVPVLGSFGKWQILSALTIEGHAASDVAKLLGCSVSGAMKHLSALVDAGLVIQGKGRVYHIAPAYRPKPGEHVVDFGYCVLRFGLKSE